MSDYLFLMESRVSPDQWLVVLQVQRTAAALGLNVYLAGGAIRDLIAGFPIEDLDFVVEGKGERLVKELTRQGARAWWQSQPLPSAEMEFAHGVQGSISMARSESYKKPATPPVIASATIVADLRRRDFPMNAIAISLNPNSRGLLLDPSNGLADIENRTIRAPHNYTFFENPVRMFRAVRLRARLGFSFDPKTAVQFQAAREDGMAEKAAGDSLAHELRQLARERNPVEVLRALEKEKLLPALSPRLQKSTIDWQAIARASKASQTLAQSGLRAPSFSLFLHLLIRKLPARDQSRLAQRLRLKAADWRLAHKQEAEAKRLAKEVGGKAGGSPTKLYQLLSKTAPDVLLLLLTGYPQGKIHSRLKAYLTKYLPLRSHLPEKELQELGVKQGSPRYQKILDAYFYAVIEGELRTSAQQQKFLARLAQQAK